MKKKYNKPLTTTTVVRQQMNFCGSIVKDPGGAVETRGHERVEMDSDTKGFNSIGDDWASNGWTDAQ